MKIFSEILKQSLVKGLNDAKGSANFFPQSRRCQAVRRIVDTQKIKPDVICMVDNCYGEFVEKQEPLEVE
mgnify:CR=1 FL=1